MDVGFIPATVCLVGAFPAARGGLWPIGKCQYDWFSCCDPLGTPALRCARHSSRAASTPITSVDCGHLLSKNSHCSVHRRIWFGRSLRGTQRSRERSILRASAGRGCGPRDFTVAFIIDGRFARCLRNLSMSGRKCRPAPRRPAIRKITMTINNHRFILHCAGWDCRFLKKAAPKTFVKLRYSLGSAVLFL